MALSPCICATRFEKFDQRASDLPIPCQLHQNAVENADDLLALVDQGHPDMAIVQVGWVGA